MTRHLKHNALRRLNLGVLGLLIGVVGALWVFRPSETYAQADTSASTKANSAVPELVGGQWLNTAGGQPLKLASRRGKVTIIEFWTANCSNCRANLPIYARWQKQFGPQGVTVVGIHTPETPQEANPEYVKRTVGQLGIEYPVLLDTNGANWKRWKQQYWPTIYVVDGQGRLRAQWVGELGQQAENFTQGIATLVAENAQTGRNGQPAKVVKSQAQWREELTPAQFEVLRNHGTEPAFSGDYKSHGHGIYLCAGCGQQLFSSETKFDSGTGWPSFFQALSPSAVEEVRDTTYGMVRTEIRCSRCGGHLGHVFDDGPRPTGLRYCMNSVALEFMKDGAATQGEH